MNAPFDATTFCLGCVAIVVTSGYVYLVSRLITKSLILLLFSPTPKTNEKRKRLEDDGKQETTYWVVSDDGELVEKSKRG